MVSQNERDKRDRKRLSQHESLIVPMRRLLPYLLLGRRAATDLRASTRGVSRTFSGAAFS